MANTCTHFVNHTSLATGNMDQTLDCLDCLPSSLERLLSFISWGFEVELPEWLTTSGAATVAPYPSPSAPPSCTAVIDMIVLQYTLHAIPLVYPCWTPPCSRQHSDWYALLHPVVDFYTLSWMVEKPRNKANSSCTGFGSFINLRRVGRSQWVAIFMSWTISIPFIAMPVKIESCDTCCLKLKQQTNMHVVKICFFFYNRIDYFCSFVPH